MCVCWTGGRGEGEEKHSACAGHSGIHFVKRTVYSELFRRVFHIGRREGKFPDIFVLSYSDFQANIYDRKWNYSEIAWKCSHSPEWGKVAQGGGGEAFLLS